MDTTTQTIETWQNERQARPIPQTVRRSGFDTAVTDTHVVDAAWIAQRRRAAELMGEVGR